MSDFRLVDIPAAYHVVCMVCGLHGRQLLLKSSFFEIPTSFLTPYRLFDYTPNTRQLIFKFSVWSQKGISERLRLNFYCTTLAEWYDGSAPAFAATAPATISAMNTRLNFI
jgi:hypothetical protein